MRRDQITIGWYGFRNTRTAVSPDLGDRTNHRRRRLDRGRGFKSRERHFFTHGTRGHASRYQNFDNICSIKHRFPTGKKQNPRQEDIQRRKQTVRPWWGRRRAATALERGCNGSLFFSWRERWARGACCLCFMFFFCLSVYLLCFYFLLSGDHFSAS